MCCTSSTAVLGCDIGLSLFFLAANVPNMDALGYCAAMSLSSCSAMYRLYSDVV